MSSFFYRMRTLLARHHSRLPLNSYRKRNAVSVTSICVPIAISFFYRLKTMWFLSEASKETKDIKKLYCVHTSPQPFDSNKEFYQFDKSTANRSRLNVIRKNSYAKWIRNTSEQTKETKKNNMSAHTNARVHRQFRRVPSERKKNHSFECLRISFFFSYSSLELNMPIFFCWFVLVSAHIQASKHLYIYMH